MKKYDDGMCAQMINDLMEYKGSYHLCFMVSIGTFNRDED